MADGGYDYLRCGAMDMDKIQLMAVGPSKEFKLIRRSQPKSTKKGKR